MNGSVLATIYAVTTRKKLCLYISLLLLSMPPVEAEGTQPNILFTVVDNQPASILGAYGNPDVKTPNIGSAVATRRDPAPDESPRTEYRPT